MLNRVIFLGILLFIHTLIFSQNNHQHLTQTVKGVVTDVESNLGLEGVTIIWKSPEGTVAAITKADGYFLFSELPIGRQSFYLSYIGYKTVEIKDILVTAGKELFLNLQMEEKIYNFDELTVTSTKNNQGINDMAAVSINVLQTAEVSRYAGTNGDVARMAQNYAGISGISDTRNDIIVRGNSPYSVLWRLEGIDIPSPNHWATLGTTGGPISILNVNNLRTSDFIAGAFPAEYGNVTGSVFDLKLRNGNTTKYEFLGQSGLNGFEVGVEGPLKNIGKQASFLINYRYSTLSLISNLGIDFGTGFAVPHYQDINFKVNIPTSKHGRFSFWGLGGISDINFLAQTDNNTQLSIGEENLRSGTNTGIVGFNHLYFFNDNSSSSLSLSFSKSKHDTDIEVVVDTITLNDLEDTFKSDYLQDKFSIKWVYNNKLTTKHRLKAGITYDIYSFNLKEAAFIEKKFWFNELEFKGNTSLVNSFVQWKYKIDKKLILNAGVNTLFFLLNKSFAVEPRVSLSYLASRRSTIAFGYGRHSQLHPIPIYFNKSHNASLIENQLNSKLDFLKSNHFILSYNYAFSPDLKMKIETYYQHLFSIAADPKDKNFSLINYGADFSFPNRVGLRNLGTGKNYGIDFTLRQSLYKGSYYLLTTSFFNSTFSGAADKEYNTAYNSNYAFNLLLGKEFLISKKLTFMIDGRFSYSGGRRYTPIDLDASIAAGEEILNTNELFKAKLLPYIRPDLKFGIRLNTQKATHSLSMDLQNFIGRKNELRKYFYQEQIKIEYQRGFFPDFRYQVLF